MKSHTLPSSLLHFTAQHETVAVADFWKGVFEDARSPYGNYCYRAVTCMLLSGRINPKVNGYPNWTQLNRVCKEANFNQCLLP